MASSTSALSWIGGARIFVEDGGAAVGVTGGYILKRVDIIQPTLTVRPGFPVRVIVNKDLVLRPYGAATRHTGGSAP